VLVVDDLFHSSNHYGCSSDLVDLVAFVLLLLVLRLQSLLVLDELLLHCQVILDALLTEEAQSALG